MLLAGLFSQNDLIPDRVFYMDAPGAFNEAIYISKTEPVRRPYMGSSTARSRKKVIFIWQPIRAECYTSLQSWERRRMIPAGCSSGYSNRGKGRFVIKLDTNGNFVWVKQFGSTVPVLSHRHICECRCQRWCDSNRWFQQYCWFDPGPAVSFISIPSGIFNLYVNDYDEFQNGQETRHFTVFTIHVYLEKWSGDQSGNIYGAGCLAEPVILIREPGLQSCIWGNADGYVLAWPWMVILFGPGKLVTQHRQFLCSTTRALDMMGG